MRCGSARMVRAAAAAEPAADLYRAQVFVTGQHEETRGPALLQGFRDILVKVSGDPTLLADPRLDGLFDASSVHAFSYRDLMADIPKHDEQGTRQRPFEMTIDFEPQKIDAALGALGRAPWSGERPRIVMLIAVQIGPSSFVIADEGEPGSVQRQALLTSARRYGVPVLFPSRDALQQSGVSVESLRQADLPALNALAAKWGGDVAFAGSMVFSEAMLGWVADWHMLSGGRPIAGRSAA